MRCNSQFTISAFVRSYAGRSASEGNGFSRYRHSWLPWFVSDPWTLISSYIGLSGIFSDGCAGSFRFGDFVTVYRDATSRSINLDTKVQKNLIGVVLRNQGLWRLNLSIFVSHYLLVSLFMVLPVLFLNTGRIEFADHSLYYLALLGISFIGMLPFMWLSDRLTDVRVLLSWLLHLP